MVYTVLYREQARDELALLWLNADSKLRAAITAASAVLETALRTNPHAIGESRTATQRMAFEPPLAILFDVREQDRQVIVLHIWQYGRSGS
jgi:hypothetical protein